MPPSDAYSAVAGIHAPLAPAATQTSPENFWLLDLPSKKARLLSSVNSRAGKPAARTAFVLRDRVMTKLLAGGLHSVWQSCLCSSV
jgi:hypothetical protein